jgi:hypothetical protein
MPASIKLNVNEVKNLINQFSLNEKIELAKFIDQMTLKNRLKKFRLTMTKLPISIKEITKEVEKIRVERYQ